MLLDFEEYEDEDRVVDDLPEFILATGIDPYHTPVDSFIRNGGAGYAVAWAMEHGDEAYPT